MNERRVAILLILALAVATYVVMKQHLTVRRKVHALLKPDNLCRLAAQCTEPFELEDDDEPTPVPIESMEACLDALEEGKECLVTHSDDPLQCIEILQRGERCLKDAIARSMYKSSPTISAIPRMIQSSASPISADAQGQEVVVAPTIPAAAALPSVVPTLIEQPDFIQSSAMPYFVSSPIPDYIGSSMPFPAMTNKGYDEIDYVVAPDTSSNQKVLLDLTKLGLSSDAIIIEPKTMY